jgi:inorganic pyrophosphatase
MMSARNAADDPTTVEVVIEVSRGSFLKRGSRGQFDFLSPFPCPYNYGSVPEYIGGDGDYLDALVLGPRLPRGGRVRVPARGAVGMTERRVYEDKLVCAAQDLSERGQRRVLFFLRCYARCKSLLNALRGRPGRVRCEGWVDAAAAVSRARPAGRAQRRNTGGTSLRGVNRDGASSRQRR